MRLAPIRPAVPSPSTPAQRDRRDAAVAAERALTIDALDRVGVPASALAGVAAFPDLAADDRVKSAGQAPDRKIEVPLGLRVGTGPGEHEYWTVVGVESEGRSVELARRTSDGHIERSRVAWPALVERNVALLDGLGGSTLEAMSLDTLKHASDGVAALGRRAPVQLAYVGPPPPQGGGFVRHQPPPLPATWGDVIDATRLAERTPVAAAPAVTGVWNLRSLVGDTRTVISRIDPAGRALVVGTESLPGPAADVIADVGATQRWFHDVAGVDVWPSDTALLVNTDSRDWLGNASASFMRLPRGPVAVLNEGPRSAEVLSAALHSLSGRDARAQRRNAEALRDSRVAVDTHEAGHVVHTRFWGSGRDGEQGVVEEAVGDLFLAARTNDRDVLGGVRKLGVLAHDTHSLDALRSWAARTGGEAHTGTQLITRPMLGVLNDVGGDVLAQITTAAVRSVGVERGSGVVGTVTIPVMASALRSATARRLGEASATVRELDRAWAQLGVPLDLGSP